MNRRVPILAAGAGNSALEGSVVQWSRKDITQWLVLATVGSASLGIGWYWCAGEARQESQGAPLTLAIMGLAVANVANVLWLMRGRRAVGLRRRLLLTADRVTARNTHPTQELAVNGAGRAMVLVTEGAEVLRFHRAGCPLTARRRVRAVHRTEAVVQGRSRCGVCQP